MTLPPFKVIPSSNGDDFSSVTVLVDIDTVRRAMEVPEFIRAFTSRELSLINHNRLGMQSIAARYAAKRAVEILTHQSWELFEVFRQPDKPPIVYEREGGTSLASRFTLSLTHDQPFAAAYVADLCKAPHLNRNCNS